ncbi:MAG TPA: hypothetical protein DCE78_00850, partial [Bacteroidetes bacterium]|nr:hypothetical protein [Bacteroidota bacterium]
MSVRLEECKDGSHTLFSEQFGQFYHNPNGAVAESWHVFFDQSDLRERLKSGTDVRILEVGFGTGLNLLLLCDLIAELGSTSRVLFQSVEAWPVDPEIAAKFNYGGFLKSADESEALVNVFRELSQGHVDVDFTQQIHVRIHRGLFDTFNPVETGFHYVFHDAFSPGVNAELWTPEIFKQIYDWCDNGATLTTYCAATKARNAMKEAGWVVTKAPG